MRSLRARTFFIRFFHQGRYSGSFHSFSFVPLIEICVDRLKMSWRFDRAFCLPSLSLSADIKGFDFSPGCLQTRSWRAMGPALFF